MIQRKRKLEVMKTKRWRGKILSSKAYSIPALVDFTAILAFFAALLYTAGWSYIFHWYGHFSIGVSGLGIPLEYHLQFGFAVFRDHWWFLFAVIILFVTSPFWRRYVKGWLWISSPVWILIVFIAVYGFGAMSANQDFIENETDGFHAYPLVRVWLDNEESASNVRTRNNLGSLSKADHRLLLQSANNLYLIRDGATVSIPVIIVPLSSVKAMRVIPRNPSYK